MSSVVEGAAETSQGPRVVAALAVGIVFGVGLAVAQMTDPRKVLAFLDIAGAWDASLLFVLGAAVLVTAVGYGWVQRRTIPVFDAAFQMPRPGRPDLPLVAGSVAFGIGWGLAGYCPGPAVASIGFGNAEALWFVPAMLASMGVQRALSRRLR